VELSEDAVRPYVGFIWIADAPGVRLNIVATSLDAARQLVVDTYGEGHVISLRNEEDAAKPR
jgi:hypothetical protein